MSGITNSRSNIRRFVATMVFIFSLLVGFITLTGTQALDLANRSIQLGTSIVSLTTEHDYSFDLVGSSTVSSLSFEYCTNTPLFDLPCTPPAGLDVTGTIIDSQTGITGFGISGSTTANHLIITRAPAPETPISTTYDFSNIMNPSTQDEIVYVRIGMFDGINATGTRVDQGSVVFVMDGIFDVSAYVPPYMTFCAAITVALDCSSTAGALADFGEFSESQATATTSQFAVATNDLTGYNTFIGGQTMTSGTNIIPALGIQTASLPGTSQFGINLRGNSSPSVGADLDVGAVASGAVDSNYNTPNQFRFVDGDRIAGSPISTGFNRYTVSYMVNIAGSQAPGIYATTFEYTSIASF